MPRRNKKRAKGKKSHRGSRGAKQSGSGNPHSQRSVLGGFPQRMKARLKYVEIFQLTGTATVAYRVYGTNCLYDPYLGTGGHQPSNFDRWMQIYDFYVVLGCECTMSYYNAATGSSTPAAFGMIASDTGSDVSALGTASYIIEQPRATYSLVTAGIVNAPRSPLQRQKWRTSDWADGADVRGMSSWWGTSSNNPGSVTYVEAWHGSLDGSTTGAFTYKFEMFFDCEFWGPHPTANSKLVGPPVRPDNWENLQRSRGLNAHPEHKEDDGVPIKMSDVPTTLPLRRSVPCAPS